MREDIDHSFNGLVPCNEPFSVSVDHLLGFAGLKDRLKLPDVLSTSLIIGEAVFSCQEMIEVDSSSGDISKKALVFYLNIYTTMF